MKKEPSLRRGRAEGPRAEADRSKLERPRPFVIVLGSGGASPAQDGPAAVLRQLGASLKLAEFWDDPADLLGSGEPHVQCLIVDAGERPDVGSRVLRHWRKERRLADVGTLLVLDHRRVAELDPSHGFDDFILSPLVPAELYARVKGLEWKASEFSTEERQKLGGTVIERAAREVWRSGELIALTAREFELLVYLADHRGRCVSRTELLEKVWKADYEGGPRTVDIHVRRLRAKLGGDFKLSTFRGAGYRLDAG